MSSSTNPEPQTLPGIPPERMPKHIAIIMDGNGRWAQAQEKERVEGHKRGAEVVRTITEECSKLGIQQLTLYCLSSENWKRPQVELEFLMLLLREYLIEERQTLMENNVVLKIIGRRDPIPEEIQIEMDRSIEMTRNNTGPTLCLAINYGARAEIVDAIQQISTKVRDGELDVQQIDETIVSEHLYTAEMVDPDMLIRTAGEMRISNYLLWQISYSEIWITQKYWPDFSIQDFHQSIKDFTQRKRRFGGLENN